MLADLAMQTKGKDASPSIQFVRNALLAGDVSTGGSRSDYSSIKVGLVANEESISSDYKSVVMCIFLALFFSTGPMDLDIRIPEVYKGLLNPSVVHQYGSGTKSNDIVDTYSG